MSTHKITGPQYTFIRKICAEQAGRHRQGVDTEIGIRQNLADHTQISSNILLVDMTRDWMDSDLYDTVSLKDNLRLDLTDDARAVIDVYVHVFEGPRSFDDRQLETNVQFYFAECTTDRGPKIKIIGWDATASNYHNLATPV